MRGPGVPLIPEGSASGAPVFFRRVWPGKLPATGVATALITVVGGQDGSYLAEFLRSKGYRVVGTTRDAAAALRRPYGHVLWDVELFEGQYFRHTLDDLLVMPLAEEGPAHLLLGMIAARQAAQRVHVRGSFGIVRRGRSPLHSKSKLCIVFSISSAAMSEVDWMPWIFSLNSSGLLARRSASS